MLQVMAHHNPTVVFADGLPAVERDCEGQQDDEETEGRCRGEQSQLPAPRGPLQTVGKILRPLQKGRLQGQEHAVTSI